MAITEEELSVIYDAIAGQHDTWDIRYQELEGGKLLFVKDAEGDHKEFTYDPTNVILYGKDGANFLFIDGVKKIYDIRGSNFNDEQYYSTLRDIGKKQSSQQVNSSGNGNNDGEGGSDKSSSDGGSDSSSISPIFSTVPSANTSTTNYGVQNPTGDDNRSKTSDENLAGATTNLTDYETYISLENKNNYKKLSEIIANYEANLTNFSNFSNNCKIKINFIIFPKYITSEDELKSKSYIFRYKTDVLKFSIKSRVKKFGYTGDMIMVDNNNSLKFLFNNMMNYYMAICISFPLDFEDVKLEYKSIIYEPYIVQLEEAEEITSNDNTIKQYKIKFRDALSAIAQDISWASIYYFNPTLQYPISFETLITGIINHLYNISDQLTGDGKITLRKDILFSEMSVPSQCTTNLASFCLSEIDPEGSVLDALDTILTYASCELPSVAKKLNNSSNLDLSWFSENEDSGILFPLYINEDYIDPYYLSKFLSADIAKNAESEKNYKSSAHINSSKSSIGNNSPIAKPIIKGDYNSSYSSSSTELPPASTAGSELNGSAENYWDEAPIPDELLEEQQDTGQISAGERTNNAYGLKEIENKRFVRDPSVPYGYILYYGTTEAVPDDGLVPVDDSSDVIEEEEVEVEYQQSEQTTTSSGLNDKSNGQSSSNNVLPLLQSLVIDKDVIKGHLFKPRHYIFKNILVPFLFAFDKNTPVISESINPIKEKNNDTISYTADELRYACFLNRMETPIYGYTTFPINLKLVSDMWKNVMFMGNMADESQTDVFYFEWLINYFAEVFLNIYETDKIPSPTPAFLIKAATLFKNMLPSAVSKNYTKKIATARDALLKANAAAKLTLGAISTVYNFVQESIDLYKKTKDSGNLTVTSQIFKNEKDKELFNYYFTNVKVLKSLYPVAEECWHLGRYLESFVHYNTSYGINIFGNLLRRPNEIIKLNKAIKIKGDEIVNTGEVNSGYSQKEEAIAIDTTSINSDSVLLYIMSVEHIFEGDTFTDKLFCNRFYDEVKGKFEKGNSSK